MEAWFNHVMLSRFQFALTTMFHINLAVLSVGLCVFLVVMEAALMGILQLLYLRGASWLSMEPSCAGLKGGQQMNPQQNSDALTN